MIVDGKKRCPGCDDDVCIDLFGICRSNADGLQSYCKVCRKLRASKNKKQKQEYDRKYNEKHKERKKKQGNRYYQDNKELISIKAKEFRSKHKVRLSKESQQYYQDNKESIIKKNNKHYHNNKESISIKTKEYRRRKFDTIRINAHNAYKSFCRSAHMIKQIPIIDKPEFDTEGYITVLCKHDGKRFRPSTGDIRRRISCVNGKTKGESNFYCTDRCAQECILYYFNSNSIDPRSTLYIPKSEQEEARRCQTRHLKILQIDEFGYNFCEKCGTEVDTVELHHTLPVAQFGLEAINSAGHLLVCNDCHKEFTKDCKINN